MSLLTAAVDRKVVHDFFNTLLNEDKGLEYLP